MKTFALLSLFMMRSPAPTPQTSTPDALFRCSDSNVNHQAVDTSTPDKPIPARNDPSDKAYARSAASMTSRQT